MSNFLFKKQWSWLAGGIALAVIFTAAAVLVKPIGVSTQFVILDGIIWNAVSSELVTKDDTAESGYASSNAYLNKSGGKYAKSIANPLNYGFVFVLAMVVGGFAAGRMQSKDGSEDGAVSEAGYKKRFSALSGKRYLAAFAGGVLALFGARLAGGCTSGHMMSGMMQTSVSGYLFAMGAFAVAVPAAIFMYKGEK
jgi:uncharacterized membrane protein YedE/YeeE